MIHNNSFNNTVVQRWSRPILWTFTTFLVSANIFCFFLGILVAPDLFQTSEVTGRICQSDNPGCGIPDDHYPWLVLPPRPLKDLEFQFQVEEDQLSSWSWRLLASLVLEVTFAEDLPPTPEPTVSTIFATAPAKENHSVQNQTISYSSIQSTNSSVHLFKESMVVGLSASLTTKDNPEVNETIHEAERHLQCTFSRGKLLALNHLMKF